MRSGSGRATPQWWPFRASRAFKRWGACGRGVAHLDAVAHVAGAKGREGRRRLAPALGPLERRHVLAVPLGLGPPHGHPHVRGAGVGDGAHLPSSTTVATRSTNTLAKGGAPSRALGAGFRASSAHGVWISEGSRCARHAPGGRPRQAGGAGCPLAAGPSGSTPAPRVRRATAIRRGEVRACRNARCGERARATEQALPSAEQKRTTTDPDGDGVAERDVLEGVGVLAEARVEVGAVRGDLVHVGRALVARDGDRDERKGARHVRARLAAAGARQRVDDVLPPARRDGQARHLRTQSATSTTTIQARFRGNDDRKSGKGSPMANAPRALARRG